MYKILKNVLNIKVILGAIIFAGTVFAALLAILWSARANRNPQVQLTAILSIIKAPTITPLVPITTPTLTLAPTDVQEEPAPSGDIVIGDYVQVSGTEGDGLRLHETAGVSSGVTYIATEAEVFLVKDGPVDLDGYTWWSLEGPYSENAKGWGVANYLEVVQNP
jgi:hypothetical protein